MSRGQLMTPKMAADAAGITGATVKVYINKGLLKTIDVAGYEFVYYRDVLRASWTAKQQLIAASKKRKEDYYRSKKKEEEK